MIIIGDSLIPYENIENISSKDDIKNSTSNSTLKFKYDEELLKYCFENDLPSMIEVNSILEAIYSNSLGSKYIVCKKELGKTIQKLAENYMFDSKILVLIDKKEEIEDIAKEYIDGVIFSSLK